MTASRRAYLPALRFRALTPLYDRVLRVLLPEERMKAMLIYQASPQPGERVLDLSCGTGTLTLALKRACPEAHVVGVDADPDALAIARSKAREANLDIELRQSFAHDTGYEERSFSIIFSSLMFHHLATEAKMRTLNHAYALLRDGGELHVLDWGKAQNVAMRAAFLTVQARDGFATTNDNVRGLLPKMMHNARFREITETVRLPTVLGTISMHRARR